jgi:hypothetical protein
MMYMTSMCTQPIWTRIIISLTKGLTVYRKTGDVTPITGKTYYAKDAEVKGKAWKQEAVSIE